MFKGDDDARVMIWDRMTGLSTADGIDMATLLPNDMLVIRGESSSTLQDRSLQNLLQVCSDPRVDNCQIISRLHFFLIAFLLCRLSSIV